MNGNKYYFTKYLSLILILLFAVNLIIILQIPYFQQVFGFIFFSVVPGYLILFSLNIHDLDPIKRFVLAVGLSIVFLMFSGFIANSFYPYISNPLSLFPILSIIDFLMLFLIYLAFKSDKGFLTKTPTASVKLRSKLISPLIFSFIFPLLAVFGTYLMNKYENNTILLLLLLIIPIYITAIVLLREKISDYTYPVALWMITISLILTHSLTSNYITGTDISKEYYIFQLVKFNSHWEPSLYFGGCNTCLSITVLPVIYDKLMNFSNLYIYKLIFQILFSITPLALFVHLKKYMTNSDSFLSCIFLISQNSFISELVEHIRQEIAILLFVLIILVLFDNLILESKKRILLISFIVGVIVSHYTTAYMLFFICFLTKLLSILPMFRTGYEAKIRTNTTLIIFTIVIFWYGLVTVHSFETVTVFFEQTFVNLKDFFMLESRDSSTTSLLGIGLGNEIPYKIQFWVRNVTFLFILTGLLSLLIYKKENKFETEYILMMIACMLLLTAMFVMPFVSKGYGITRLFIQTLVLLSPCFVLGGYRIFSILESGFLRKIHIKKISAVLFILVVLVLQNFCATTLIFNIFGLPLSEDLNNHGNYRESLYIYEQEVSGARWLAKYNLQERIIHSDKPGWQRIYLGYELEKKYNSVPPIDELFFSDSRPKPGYIYLRRTNLIDKKIHSVSLLPTSSQVTNIENYSHLFTKANKIYNNNEAEVWV